MMLEITINFFTKKKKIYTEHGNKIQMVLLILPWV